MSGIEIRLCTEADLDKLADFNRQLIEDEKHDNRMDKNELRERMKGFITTGYNAYFFSDGIDLVGYALVDMTKHPYYLRQFFIARDKRRGGLGKISFQKLLDILDTKTVDLEVLVWNDIGKRFWKSLGFKERSLYMRLEE